MHLQALPLALLLAVVTAAPQGKPLPNKTTSTQCKETALLSTFSVSTNLPTASAFCSKYIASTVTETYNSFVTTSTTTTYGLGSTVTVVDTITATSTATVTRTDTSTRTVNPSSQFKRRQVNNGGLTKTTATPSETAKPNPDYPAFIPGTILPETVSAACSCLVTASALPTLTVSEPVVNTIWVTLSTTVSIPTVSATATKTAIATATAVKQVTRDIFCNHQGVSNGNYLISGSWAASSSVSQCLSQCRGLANNQCKAIHFGLAEGQYYCGLYGVAALDKVYSLGSSQYGNSFSFWDKDCSA